MSARESWYLLAYDIRDDARLRRVHRHLKRHGLALQRSLFLVRADRRGLDRILAGVNDIIQSRADDVRVYPVDGPERLWTGGRDAAIAAASPAPGQTPKPRGALVRLFGSGASKPTRT